ncbi:ribosome maturation factor RimP [Marinospirillum alkaliphilum]|uniref:Ribosome maturation factor RimP n=1 Tax=Marinospirillum alkaliphilum DSM 21637 TaxID=1122209 RepID=A0A1K1Y790_9GAMM|nr:ribosome maturation factor RimP [Marinospirillum alkaliphilum]SFX57197.1 ribosome maturation factor RimP [Marinospirillum alkaliphilum DSM 21637]
MASKDKLLEQLIEPVVQSLGFEFWGLELTGRGTNLLLRVYIESEQGITVDHCAQVSRQVSALMDVEDPIPGEYTLEVSSPGMDRPLFRLDQYQRYAGEQIQIKLRLPYEGQRKFSGLLKGVEADEVILQVEDEEYCFPIETIDQARVKPDLDKHKK